MNLEIHHNSQSDYFDIIKEKFINKIQVIKNSKLLIPKLKKVEIKEIRKAFLKEMKDANFNNF